MTGETTEVMCAGRDNRAEKADFRKGKTEHNNLKTIQP